MTDSLTKNHSFSIVIPTYNERDNITNCLDSILNQNYDMSLVDIVIVDGHSTDDTIDKIKEYQQKFSNISVLENPVRKTPTSLNIGIKKSNGEVIIILGAHASLDPDFIFFNNKYLNEKNLKITGGTQINVGFTFVQKAIAMAMENPFGMGSAPYRWSRKEQFVDTVVYAAYKRELFDEIGYFQENFSISEDSELNWRIRKAGYKIFFSPNIKSYYHPRRTVSKFVQQMFRYGILRVHMFKKHNSAVKITHLVPPSFVVTLMIILILTLFSVLNPIFLFTVLLCYFLVNLLSVFLKISKENLHFIPLISFIIFLLHFSWGLGFIVGLFLPRSKRW
ncbi:MAG: glycosyltransferase family 2 protein [Ignavibacteriaceae bacterium]|jgi:cellulose synthase/poly-beta-1,6-N-acetylglucosamine synthase-like glycosyltransferase|nr:glycosyltransferase family 2 protein [Chlorobium sp.]MCW8817964.1 glycosyltransferase family 2 protein [Ignavibacteriaceae bacterium]MCW8823390.1 glycosyltransferase family 2 protein [Ignavibacteriaceae bacterium]MCW8961916.1 glycosyltransferase family 2 protein [Ignavibacteriaceae bacterium]